MKELFRGAEAVVYEDRGAIVKDRPKKGYRSAELDGLLRKKRTRAEAHILREARRNGIDVPQVLGEEAFSLRLEKIAGKRAKDAISENVAIKAGEALGKLHSANIVHGDFTPANIIVSREKLHVIDFGLAFFSQRAEDKAGDLHLFKESVKASFPARAESLWTALLEGYKTRYSGAEEAIKILRTIEKRGRYKE